MGLVTGGSKCLACAKQLRWYELLPVCSFLLQRGQCRRCFSKISWQYPLVELVTGLLFWFSLRVFGLTAILPLYLVIMSLLIVITVYDLRHKIIPDGLVYAFIILSIVPALVSGDRGVIWSHLLAGLVLFLFFFLLWRISDGRWMGFGDAKLAVGVGFLLGLSGGVSAIVLAFWIGAAIGVILLALSHWRWGRKRFNMKSEIPFAPFIVLGLLLNLLYHLNVASLFIS
jgi:leader peptidase (prepilin peptidase)/N-methyltransferase